MLNYLNSYYAKNILFFFVLLTNISINMKIRVFPSHDDTYNCIIIDTDDLFLFHNNFHPVELPTVFVSDLIEDLISKN